jgi:hypothetical protein
MGRHGPHGLHRPPAGLVQGRAHPRRHAGPPGTVRSAAGLGRRQARLVSPGARALVRACDARAARRVRAGVAAQGRRRDSRGGQMASPCTRSRRSVPWWPTASW